MGIELLFFLLAILYGLESVSSIARATGIWSGNVYNGIVVQNALSLFSRLVMFLFMPVMGYFFDKGNYDDVATDDYRFTVQTSIVCFG